MKAGDVVSVRGYKATARVVRVDTFPDASRAQVCELDRILGANRLRSRTWRTSDLVLVEAARPLKLINGHWNFGTPHREDVHAYVAGYSFEDCARAIEEVLGYRPNWLRGVLRSHWSKNCWGTAMEGIAPARGVWLQFGRGAVPQLQMPKQVPA